MDLLGAAKVAKHGVWLAGRRTRPARVRFRGAAWSIAATVRPYRFDRNRYLDHKGFAPFDFFLDRDAPAGWVMPGAPRSRRLWLVWAGANALSDNRLASLDALHRTHSDLDITLITPENVHGYEVDGHPLHSAYPHLSAVHRSDYLRAYLLHHYGGAYSDIKFVGAGLAEAVDRTQSEVGPMLVGYPEIDSDLVDNLHGPVGRDVRRNYRRIVGMGAMAAQPRTPFTAEWLAEVERRLDYYSTLLTAFPAQDAYGATGGYAVTWIGIGADVFQPLQLKYLERVEARPELTPILRDYR